MILGARWIYGPLGPFPGPKLRGPVVEEPLEDWSWIDAVKVIQIETDPEDPYSVDLRVNRVGNRIHVSGNDESPGVRNICDDPQVRIRVGGRIYACRAVEVTDREEKRIFLTALKSKYGDDFWFDRDSHQRPWETGEFLLLRLEPR